MLVIENVGDHCFAENVLTYDIENDTIIDQIIFKDVNYKSNFYFKFLKDTIKTYKYDSTINNSDVLINNIIIDENGRIVYHK